MDFNFTPEEEAFRTEVRSFIEAHLPAPDDREDPVALEAWHDLAIEREIDLLGPVEQRAAGVKTIGHLKPPNPAAWP